VTGPELLDGLRVYALEQFGPLTKTVLNSWGVRRCQDFGDIVFNLIEYNAFSKTDNDRREDFADIYEFDDVFVKPFLPTQRPRGTSAAEAVGRLTEHPDAESQTPPRRTAPSWTRSGASPSSAPSCRTA
jgi:hypothetical protein